MARRGRRRQRGILGRFAREWQGFELDPETKKNILALLLFLAGIVSVLSLFHAAGRLGEWLRPHLFRLFGWGGYVFPFLLALVSLLRLDPDRFRVSRGRYLGFFFIVLASHGLLHLVKPAEEGLVLVDEGRGGGYLGWLVSYWLRVSVGDAAGALLLGVAFLIGLLMVTNRTPGEFLAAMRAHRVRGEEFEEEPREEEADVPADAETPASEEERGEGQPTLPIFATRLMDSVKLRGGGEAMDLRDGARATRRARAASYARPPLGLLSDATTRPASGDVKRAQAVIQKTLETFGIPVTMEEVHVGPTVTQYTLKPEEGVKLSKITALHADLALALSAHPIRIEAPVPGKALVGIEVPNRAVSIVRLREILESSVFRGARSPLAFPLGKDVTGQPVVEDLARMPHLLIAGATGSGKSVMINTIITSFLYRNDPGTLRLLLVDPKRVELAIYGGVPHLLAPVVTEPEKSVHALRWIVGEMDRRYGLLSESHSRDVASYNARHDEGRALPYVVVVIDELADIMARHGREVEGSIVRIAQMARAVAMHLVVSTQRPSVDVITGLIKANMNSRIAFNVASAVDSRTILDVAGADKLLGNGDMLFLRGDTSKPRRLQAAYVSEEEVRRVVSFLSGRHMQDFDASLMAQQRAPVGAGDFPEDDEEGVDDALMEEAERVVREAGRASTSLLQRRLRIGYARAARIIDHLEQRGVVGPADGSRPREVLLPEDTDHPPARPAPPEGGEDEDDGARLSPGGPEV